MDMDPKVDNLDRLDMVVSNVPAGAGYKNLMHYAQLINCKTEQSIRYDYESAEAN